jgi:hypothetical protein
VSHAAVWSWFAFLLAALWLLRARLLREVGVSLRRALGLGLAAGALLDLAVALAVAGVAACVGARWPALAHPAALAATALVLAFTAANVAFFGYFEARLDPWVIASHLRDLPAIRGSVRRVLGVPALAAAAVVVPLLLLAPRWMARVAGAAPSPAAPVASVAFGAALVAASLVIVLDAMRLKRRLVGGSSILAEQVFMSWVEGAIGALPWHELERRGMERRLREAAAVDPAAPGRVLAQLRDWDSQGEPAPAPDLPAGGGAAPLVRALDPDPARTRALRGRLGLPADGPIHVVVVFLESVRAFELEHPELWPHVFPRTRELLARHALRFPTAYSSAPDTGKTVQGQLATLSSLLPNFGGTAAYISHPHLRVTSLAELARGHDYHTVWISGGRENFHNKRVFESLHGTDRFFDYEHMRAVPFEGTRPKCGYPDGPMLREAVRILTREARDGRPVFANVLTLSTHHPVCEIPEGRVPPALRAAATRPPAHADYVGYLSCLRYVDESLPPFFDALFASPLGDRTLVVLLGDHGARYRPHLPVAEHQTVELMARIPFALVTKRPPAPGVVAHAVHQIDVAPTVADVAGFRGTVAWVGRNVLDGSGSPWVLAENERLHYRVGDRAGYTLQGDDVPTCYRVGAGIDPMLSAELPRAPADPADVRFFQSVAVAARQAVTLNLVMPDARRA